MKLFKNSQKLRLIISGVHFHTTAKQIRQGIGDHYPTNAAAQKCLYALEHMRHVEPIKPVGMGGTWEGYNTQIDMMP